MTSYNSRSRRLTKGGLITSLLVASTLLVMSATLSSAHALALYSFTPTQQGLVKQDTLTTGDTSYWTFSGSAVLQGAPTTFSEDAQGLHLGIKAAVSGQWAGYYAVSPDTSAFLFHAVLTLPSTTISDTAPNAQFNTGLYVQTAPLPKINYVTCSGAVNFFGYYWGVWLASGNPNQATTITPLWFMWMNNQPLTRDCTIITNGNNLLKVYLDGTLVFSSTTMNLNIPPPFDSFLEVQTTSAAQMLSSTYTDYYATTSGTVTVASAPLSSRVTIEDASGKVLASAQTDSNGNAVLNVEKLHMPLQGYIRSYGLDLLGGGVMTATTSSPVTIWGGDSYAATLGPSLAPGSAASAPTNAPSSSAGTSSGPLSADTVTPTARQSLSSASATLPTQISPTASPDAFGVTDVVTTRTTDTAGLVTQPSSVVDFPTLSL